MMVNFSTPMSEHPCKIFCKGVALMQSAIHAPGFLLTFLYGIGNTGYHTVPLHVSEGTLFLLNPEVTVKLTDN